MKPAPSAPSVSDQNRQASHSAEAAPKRLSKVYLRFSDFTGTAYQKVCNLLEIFEDGTFPVILYNGSENKYVPYPNGVAMSDYVRREIEAILGPENVVFR